MKILGSDGHRCLPNCPARGTLHGVVTHEKTDWFLAI
jgi:hypothetical protein